MKDEFIFSMVQDFLVILSINIHCLIDCLIDLNRTYLVQFIDSSHVNSPASLPIPSFKRDSHRYYLHSSDNLKWKVLQSLVFKRMSVQCHLQFAIPLQRKEFYCLNTHCQKLYYYSYFIELLEFNSCFGHSSLPIIKI